tara:strand:+ start:339 stop:707 length:369 start_codon:yes stop_codon:yes gene_type:complete
MSQNWERNKAGVPMPHTTVSRRTAKFAAGGSRKEMPDEYRGPCCGGTRQEGEKGYSVCQEGGWLRGFYYKKGALYTVCAKCRNPLLTKEQKEAVAKLCEAKNHIAMLVRAKRQREKEAGEQE